MRVEQLWRFPVKSFGGEQLETIAVDEKGFAGDRRWAVLDVTTGKVLTARRSPDLLFGSARVTPSGDLDARLPDGAAADDASLSAWLGFPVRLISAAPGVSGSYETPLDFEDEANATWFPWDGPDGVFHDSKRTQMSLLSRETAGAWDLRRFRSNIVVDVGPEDDLVGQRVRLGTVEATVSKPIDRCVMTTRPQPGLDRDLDVLRTINRERAGNLGVGLLVATTGVISVGDEVTAL